MTPARTMKSDDHPLRRAARTPRSSRALVEKPPVGIVVRACASAWNGVISLVDARQPERERIANEHGGEGDVEQPDAPRGVADPRAASVSISGPGSS